MFRNKVIAFFLAIFTSSVCPAAFAGSYGEVSISPSKAVTYSASTPIFSPASSATDVAQIVGSSSKAVKIVKITCNYTEASSVDTQNLALIKRSSATSGAISDAVVPWDSATPASGASVGHFTSNGTLGGTVGQIASNNIQSAVGDSSFQATGHFVLFEAGYTIPPIALHGTSEALAVSSNGVSFGTSTPKVQFDITWYEE